MKGRVAARPALLPRLAAIFALALVGITCRDRDPMGPGLPSQAALAIAPRMERGAASGGPSFVSLRTVRGVLTPTNGGASYSADANFVNDTATLAFDVTFAGPTQRYTLTLAAIDTAGDTLFRSMREVTASPGTNAPVHDTLRYVAPDTAVSSIALALADTIVLGADTLRVSATGFDAKGQAVNPLYIGWSSRDTLAARVISSGPSTGKIIGGDLDALVWIVGRAFNGVADSLTVRIAARAASVVIAADTLRTIAGGAVNTSAVVLDRAGVQLDRAVVWAALDTTIAVVQPLLGSGAAAAGAVAAQLVTVTGVRAGTTRIVATSGTTADTSVVVVAPAPVAVVKIVPDSLAILVGDSARFGVVLLDARGDTLSRRAVSWTTADAKLATIDLTGGTVRGIAPGTVAITATSEGIVDTAWVRIAAQPLAIARTAVSPKTLRFLALGESSQLVAQSFAPDSSLAPGRYSWSVRGAAGVVSVDSLGRVVALGIGKAWVVATEQGGTADSADVSVDQLVQTVQLTPGVVRGTVGDTVRFSATLHSVTVAAGSSSSALIWLKATGAVGEMGDIVFARPGYGSFRARIRVVAGAQGVIALNPGR
ncbi:MAG TPA: Ig-like domain-containing protein [Gemmatimonadaceae bacterium]|nr:Ig-like domain-containing protein [Gemmatimonadaceae bacterium]